MVGAESRPQELIYTIQIRFDDGGFAAGNAPPDAPSGSEVILGQSAKSNDRHVGRDGGDGNVGVVVLLPVNVNDQLVVNLIGKDDQVVAAREFCNLLEHFASTHRAGGVVGIDQHNAARPRRYLF